MYKNLSWFKRYYALHKGVIRKLVCVMLLASSLGMLLPYITSKRLLSVANPDFSLALGLSGAFMGIILFHHIFWFFWEKIGSVLTQKVALDIRRDITSAFMDTRLSCLRGKSSGFYIERLGDDVMEVAALPSNLLGISADCLTNFSFLVIIYMLSVPCGVIFTMGLLFVFVINLAKIKTDLRYTEMLKELNERAASKVGENFAGIRDIKALGIKARTVEITTGIYSSIADIQMKKDRASALYSRCKTFTQYLIESVIIVFAVGRLIPANRISVVVLLTIVNYSGMMYDLVEFVANVKDWLTRGEYKAGRILALMDGSVRETFGNVESLDNFGVSVRNFSFAYEDGGELLQNINVEIPENSAAVFYGASGGGKSTLFYAIAGLLKCDNGMVFIGGTDINNLSENALRNAVCLVSQDVFLVNDTILENLRAVRPGASRADAERVCREAHIHDEIMAMEHGYDTMVAAGGSNLSGGQKQRLAIARALLKDCPIILFDEPTSHLDEKNHALFMAAVSGMKSHKTVLLIAHRLADVGTFDRAYELENGQLICHQ